MACPPAISLTIRGFSARTDMFVDGVRDFGGYSRDSFNLEQVEVAKGPTSALAGRGSTGGAINQVSKAPNLSADRATPTSAAATPSYQRGDARRQPAAPDRRCPARSIRLNAMWTDTDVPGRDAVASHALGRRAVDRRSALGTPTRATVSYFKLDQDNLPDYGLPWVPANTNPELAALRQRRAAGRSVQLLRTRRRATTRRPTPTWRPLDVAHDLGAPATLRNLTRWGRNVRDSVITAPRFAAREHAARRSTASSSRAT